MSVISKLAEYFAQFPGIGPRQSRRFVYYLLRQKKETIDELIALLGKLKEDIQICSSCYRYFSSPPARGARAGNEKKLCSICVDKGRSDDVLMVVEKDIDVENIERSGVFTGKYFVLGGTVSLLDKNPEKKIRSKELSSLVEKKVKDNTIKEITLALGATPEGEETGNYLTELLSPLVSKHNIVLSQLGRGLSTGSELEYSDTQTLKDAFATRR